ncbi:acyclic terpene utilization AtuA family protein [Agromyces bauzanensis]
MTGAEPASDRMVRIAAGCSFDTRCSLEQHAENPELDYVVIDYLTEGTIAMLARARLRDADAGFGQSFLSDDVLDFLPRLVANGTRLITNAGGLNPDRCAEMLADALHALGVQARIAVVSGDELLEQAPVACANVYLGAEPIARALDRGADIVITGRVVDSALTVGPLIHEFGWAMDDYERLGRATIIGHLLECGAHPTGAAHTDWRKADWSCSSFPIASCTDDGIATFTASAGRGLISAGTLAEQILYEIGDPSRYEMPDVICELRGVRISEVGPSAYRVDGAHGRQPSGLLKLNRFTMTGSRATYAATVVGPDAAEIARATVDAIRMRFDAYLATKGLAPARVFHVELLDGRPEVNGTRPDRLETMFRIVVDHADPTALEHLLRVATASVVSMGPGTSGPIALGIEPLLEMTSELVPRDGFIGRVRIVGEEWTEVPFSALEASTAPDPDTEEFLDHATLDHGAGRPITERAWLRSGDKGPTANIGIAARTEEEFAYLCAHLQGDRILGWLKTVAPELTPTGVRVFTLPELSAFNIVLESALDQGAVASPRHDAMGKSLGQLLGRMPI